MSFKDSVLGLLIIFIWGFNFTVIKWGVADLPPLLMGAGRFLLVALLGCFFIKRPNIPFKWLCYYALALCFGQFSLLFCAIAFGMPAGLASIVLQSQAMFTIVIAALFLHEKIKPVQIIAMLIAGCGLLVIGLSKNEQSMTLIGFALTIASAVSWGIGNVINRQINQLGYQANIGLVVWSAWIAFIPFMLASLYFEGWQQISSSIENITVSAMSVLLYLAIAASILGYSLWSYLLQHYPAGQVAPLTLGVPVVGIICADFFLSETIGASQWLGITLVMFGLLINTFSGKLVGRFKRYRSI